jgi:hypothetical protein
VVVQTVLRTGRKIRLLVVPVCAPSATPFKEGLDFMAFFHEKTFTLVYPVSGGSALNQKLATWAPITFREP